MWLNEYTWMVVVILFGWCQCAWELLVRRGTSWHKGVVVISTAQTVVMG